MAGVGAISADLCFRNAHRTRAQNVDRREPPGAPYRHFGAPGTTRGRASEVTLRTRSPKLVSPLREPTDGVSHFHPKDDEANEKLAEDKFGPRRSNAGSCARVPLPTRIDELERELADEHRRDALAGMLVCHP